MHPVPDRLVVLTFDGRRADVELVGPLLAFYVTEGLGFEDKSRFLSGTRSGGCTTPASRSAVTRIAVICLHGVVDRALLGIEVPDDRSRGAPAALDEVHIKPRPADGLN